MNKKLLILFLSFVFCGALQTAFAQSTGLSGFDLHLFKPPVDGSGVLNVHGSKVLDSGKFNLGVVTEASHGLLAANNPLTGQSVRVVNDFVTSNFQGAFGVTRFFQVGLNLPIVIFEQGTDLNTLQSFKTVSLGDIHFDLKLNVLKDAAWKPGIAVLSETSFPSGDTGKFTGNSKVGEEVSLVIDKKISPVYLTANIGYRTVGSTQVAGLDVDDQATFGGGASWTLPLASRSVDLMGEIDGTKVLRSSAQLTTPVEWLAGVKKHFGNSWATQVAGGRGITNGVGGGEWRVIAGLHWSPTFKIGTKGEKAILIETVYFRFDKDQFLPKYKPRLKEVAEKIRSLPKSKLKLRGHTDNEGTEEYNLDLSRRRADGVRRLLIKQGILEKKIMMEALGSKEPVSENLTAEGKAKNRRVEILKIP